MEENAYMAELEQALKKAGASNIPDILAEYRDFFLRKQNDGFSYEDAVAKLERPDVIAKQFSPEHRRRKRGPSALVVAGLVLAGIFAACFFIFLFAWAVAFGVLAACFAVFGICLLFGANIENLIPFIPIIPSMLLGIALIALTVLTVILAIYCWLYALQLLRIYCHWNKNMFSCTYSPPRPKHPQLSAKTTRKLRDTSLFSATIFASFFAASLTLLCVYCKSIAFWKVLGWF